MQDICSHCGLEKDVQPETPDQGTSAVFCSDCLALSSRDRNIAEYVKVADINIGERFREEYKDIDKLAESIRKFGLMQYPVLDQDNNLVAGGRRMQAIALLDWKIVQIVRKRNVDELRLREMELEENIQRVNLTWQEDAKLRRAILDIKQKIYGVKGPGKSSGISANEIAEQMKESPSSFSADVRLADAMKVIPELENCKDKASAFKMMKGLYEKLLVDELEVRRQAQPHTLSNKVTKADEWFIIGDAIKDLPLINENQRWGFIDVDTPYAIDLMQVKKNQSSVKVVEHNYLEWSPEEYVAKCTSLATDLYRLAADDCWMVWWFAIQNYQPLRDLLESVGWEVRPVPAIWNAKGGAQTNAPEVHLASSYEAFFICAKGKPILQQRGRSNVFEFQKLDAMKKIHPTEKPIELYTEILKTFCRKDTPAYSAFLGSGVIIRAALGLDMYLTGRDLNEEVKKRFLVKVQESYPNE